MGFVATTSGKPQDAIIVQNDGFFPDINLTDLRLAGRILDKAITDERLRACVVAAIIRLNNDLSTVKETALKQGMATLADMPATQIDGLSARVQLYSRAVIALVKAETIERSRDVDITAHGGKDVDAQGETISDLRRDAAYAVREIMGRPRIYAELI